MAFKYSCFLSHRHVESENVLYTNFYEALYRTLSNRMEAHLSLPVFWDRRRLQGGYDAENAICRALSQSVCMIMVYTRPYFDAPRLNCTREYFGMLNIQKCRFSALRGGQETGELGLAIPIALRGALPAWVSPVPLDFKTYGLAGRIHSYKSAMAVIEKQFSNAIEQICNRVRVLYDLFNDDDCPNGHFTDPRNFEFPTDEKARAILEEKSGIRKAPAILEKSGIQGDTDFPKRNANDRDEPFRSSGCGDGSSDGSDIEKARQDQVTFSAFCPKTVAANAAFVLSILAYLPEQRDQAIQRAHTIGSRRKVEVGWKSPLMITRNTTITVLVSFDDFVVNEPKDTFEWLGEIAGTDFIVDVPDGIEPREYQGYARVFVGGCQKARFILRINVGEQTDMELSIHESQPIRTAFASYSESDRPEALQWKQHVKSVGVDGFVGVLSLRTGENWENRLLEEIPQRDLFCLFWSLAASKSEWVEKEWRAALDARGLDFIQPIPLVDVRDVPPPDRLRKCHFWDDLWTSREYEKHWRDKKEQ